MTRSDDREQKFSWFYRGEFPVVVRTVRLMLGDRDLAQEIAQEAFVRMLARWEIVSRYDRPDLWVRKVAVRLAIKAAGRRRAHQELTHEIEPAMDAATSDVDLMAAIATLPGRQKAAIALFYLEDRPLSEVAGVLDCSVSTAAVHLHRARKRLAAQLREEVPDVGR